MTIGMAHDVAILSRDLRAAGIVMPPHLSELPVDEWIKAARRALEQQRTK